MKLKINCRSVQVDLREYDRDAVTAKHTAFENFDRLVNAPHYRPSIYLGGKKAKEQRELLFLTFEYNRYQTARQDTRRVFKGDWEPVFPREHPLLAVDIPRCECPDCKDMAVAAAPVSINGHPKRIVYVCQTHLDAAQEDCSHKFVDSTCCLKCGWKSSSVLLLTPQPD
ncbi:MAG: hypothetical protein ACOYB3_01025 [Azonexus sp.]